MRRLDQVPIVDRALEDETLLPLALENPLQRSIARSEDNGNGSGEAMYAKDPVEPGKAGEGFWNS